MARDRGYHSNVSWDKESRRSDQSVSQVDVRGIAFND